MITEFKNENRFLSNFYPCLIEYEGITYPSSEHAYQAAKAPDEATKVVISLLIDPGQAKKFGQKIRCRPDWESVKLGIMTGILIVKFKNPILKQLLLNTGNQELQEGNWWGDEYWGINLRTGKGLNMLGVTLMKIREEIQQQ
jgi:ribA/ribD-fused uncharacterized protein